MMQMIPIIPQYINHGHPAAMAAKITSDALREVYLSRYKATTQSERRSFVKAYRLTERVHSRVCKTLTSTPEAWIS